MNQRRRAYLAGERPGDVLIYLADDAVDDADRLASEGGGERVAGGTVVVVDGERGRRAFAAATGTDPMSFAGRARGREGRVERDLTGGTCPDDTGSAGAGDGGPGAAVGTESDEGDSDDGDSVPDGDGGTDAVGAADGERGEHRLRFLFSFAEAEQPDGDGIYAEGDVVHAYAQCSCGVAYSDRWVADGGD